jgi:hypothetical protein
VTLVLVSREALEKLLRDFYHTNHDTSADVVTLHPADPIVTVAVEAGILIPGPMAPGTVPPAPYPYFKEVVDVVGGLVSAAVWLGEVTAPTYRADDDPRLRCTEDGKVVYTSIEAAEHAASKISEREPMRAYLGRCGHYHVSRRRK